MIPVTGLRIQMGCGEPLQSRWRVSRLATLSVAEENSLKVRKAKPMRASSRQEAKCKPC